MKKMEYKSKLFLVIALVPVLFCHLGSNVIALAVSFSYQLSFKKIFLIVRKSKTKYEKFLYKKCCIKNFLPFLLLQGNVQLLRYNRRQITKALYFRDTALSQRYQQIENIRTVRIFSFVTLVVSFGTSGLILFAFLYVALSAKYVSTYF